LSTWKKGGNVTHTNVDRVANKYGLDAHLLYDVKSLIEKLIGDCPDHLIRGQYGEMLAEYTYLANAHSKPVES